MQLVLASSQMHGAADVRIALLPACNETAGRPLTGGVVDPIVRSEPAKN
jgi:hypothetical protein